MFDLCDFIKAENSRKQYENFKIVLMITKYSDNVKYLFELHLSVYFYVEKLAVYTKIVETISFRLDVIKL